MNIQPLIRFVFVSIILLLVGQILVQLLPEPKFEQVEAKEIQIEKEVEVKIIEVEKEVIKEVEKEIYIYITEEFSRENVLNYMRMKGLGNEEVKTFDRIIDKESGWGLDARPPVNVNHCYTEARGWFAIELTAGGIQDKCENYNAIQGRVEYSYGLFQILLSNAENYNCNLDTWQGQVDCALIIKEKQGFSAWTTYFLI